MGNKRTSRPKTRVTPAFTEPLDHAWVLVDTICRLADADSLTGPNTGRLRQAIIDRDTPYLFKHLVRSFSLQGISDCAGDLRGLQHPAMERVKASFR